MIYRLCVNELYLVNKNTIERTKKGLVRSFTAPCGSV